MINQVSFNSALLRQSVENPPVESRVQRYLSIARHYLSRVAEFFASLVRGLSQKIFAIRIFSRKEQDSQTKPVPTLTVNPDSNHVTTDIPPERIDTKEIISEISQEKKIAQQKLQGLWENYKAIKTNQGAEFFFSQANLLAFFQWDRSTSSLNADSGLSNLVSTFENDPRVYFIPDPHYLGLLSEKLLNINKEGWVSTLEEILRSAFILDKEMVVTRLSNSGHDVGAVFKADGSFKIIDSMDSTILEVNELASQLNQGNIKDSNGNPIHFSGEYTQSGIQKGGHECQLFATLYLYQIAKTGDCNAYQQVNAAFAEGQLNKFEDYIHIDTTKKLLRGDRIPVEKYRPFFRSWGHRLVGVRAERWQDITIKEIVQISLPDTKVGEVTISHDDNTKENSFPRTRYLSIFGQKKVSSAKVIVKKDGSEIEVSCLPEVDVHATLGSLIPTNSEKTVLLFEKGKEIPSLYTVSKDEVVSLRLTSPENAISNIDL